MFKNIVFLVAILFLNGGAEARTCIQSISLDEEIKSTKNIFIAKIIAARVTKENNSGFPLEFEAEFKVLEVLKGGEKLNFEYLRKDRGGSFKFIPGYRYLVFTDNGEVGGCSNGTRYSSFGKLTEEDSVLLNIIRDIVKE